MVGIRQQRGASWAVWLIFIGLLGLVGSAALRLTPTYMQYWTLKTEMADVFEQAQRQNMSTPGVRETLQKRLEISGVDIVGMSDIQIETDPKVRIEADFEVREKLGFNIDAVLMFKPTFEEGV